MRCRSGLLGQAYNKPSVDGPKAQTIGRANEAEKPQATELETAMKSTVHYHPAIVDRRIVGDALSVHGYGRGKILVPVIQLQSLQGVADS